MTGRKMATPFNRLRTAHDDIEMHNRVHRWAVDTYTVEHPRALQARSELAAAVLALCEIRGEHKARNHYLSARPLTFDELAVMAGPALDGAYGHTIVDLRKQLLSEIRAERQADFAATERAAKRKA